MIDRLMQGKSCSCHRRTCTVSQLYAFFSADSTDLSKWFGKKISFNLADEPAATEDFKRSTSDLRDN